MYKELLRKAYLLYLNARYGNKHWCHYYQELQRIQWWPKEQLEELQLERLQALVKHAYQNVPYYHRKFTEAKLRPDDIRTLADLTKLPALTKKDIREYRDELVARNLPKNKLIPSATGGSTGEPLQFYIDEECRNRGSAATHLVYSWYGYERGDKLAYLWGSPRDITRMQSLSNRILLRIFRTVYLDAFNMSESNMAEFARKLSRLKPKIIIAYASAAYLFARYLKHHGIKSIKPEAVVTEAEKLFPEQRELIQEVFGCEVFDLYGSREMSTIAAECPQHNGYHIFTPNVILEFVRDNHPVSSGEMGKILVTDLRNYAMPFIRYENGDLGVPSQEKCPCGRGLPLMQEIVGRASDVIVGAGGKYIHGEFFTHVLWDKLWVKQFQVKQDKDRNITLSIVPETQPEAGELEALKAIIQQELGEEIKLDILLSDSITLTESGKYRFTISEAPLPF